MALQYGSKGEAVRDLQLKLMALGFRLPIYGADGVFGSETEKAVKDFQYTWGIRVDGVVGPETQAAITEAMSLLSAGLWNPNLDPMEYTEYAPTRQPGAISTRVPSGVYPAIAGFDTKWLLFAVAGAFVVYLLSGKKRK